MTASFSQVPETIEPQPIENNEINIGAYLNAIKRHWLIFALSFSGILSLTSLYVFTRVPIYQANGIILVQRQNQAGALAGLGSLGDLGGLSNQSSPLNTQIEIFKTNDVIERTIKDLNIEDKRNDELISVTDFLKGVDITPIPRTDLMQISYEDEDPELAVKVVNNLMDSYIQNGIRINRIQKSAARKFIESQLPSAEKNLLLSLEKSRQFRDQTGIVSLEAQTPALITQMTNIQNQMTQLEVQLNGLEQSQETLRNLMGASVLEANDLTTLAQSAGVQSAISKLQETESELASMQSRYQVNHPDVQALLRKREAQNKLLASRINQLLDESRIPKAENPTSLQRGTIDLGLLNQLVTNSIQINSLNQQLKTLENARTQQQKQLNSLPSLQQTLFRLQLDQEANRTRYTALLTAYQNAQLSENQDVGNSVIVQSATLLDKPVSPRILRTLFLGGVLGIVLSLGLVWLFDQIDSSLRTEEEIRQIYNFTILGTIPDIKQVQPKSSLESSIDIGRAANLIVRDQPRSPVSEAYRMLLTNLKFSISDNSHKIITITSGVPGEGKSTTLANLALAMNELGLRVLIIDADLRRPSQHELWQIPNRLGFSNLLAASTHVNDILYSEAENLDVITAGEIPPNPVALLSSPRLPEILDDLKELYDYILIDCPPITVAADSLLLGRVANGALIVARPNVLTRPASNKLNASIKQSRQNVLGLVLNGIQQNNLQEMYYYKYDSDQAHEQSFHKRIHERIKKLKS